MTQAGIAPISYGQAFPLHVSMADIVCRVSGRRPASDIVYVDDLLAVIGRTHTEIERALEERVLS